MNRLVRALKRENKERPPVWLMRQAGRYHAHYQALRAQHSFIDLCKKPEVACEATMGPMRDFGFDAAILFSDLLFPLEAMGMGLTYEPGPKLSWHLREPADLARLGGGTALASHMNFQADAMRMIRNRLPNDRGLLGFVGGPMTLFYYAAEGSHQGGLGNAHAGLSDGRFDGFNERLLDFLAANMALQADGGADAIAVLDTCAGEVDAVEYRLKIVPTLEALLDRFKRLRPATPVVYYSRGTGPDHWRALEGLPIAGLGIDWRHDIADVLTRFGDRWAIQGNVDPEWLRDLPADELERRVREIFERVKRLPAEARAGWICGLGHGVLPKTPEENVRRFVRLQHEVFA